ncbi:hypothetical protein [Aurantimonas sp. VKM B-3413]|uniref:hypothetical protein n=1 Tax=Aurantimonas sp. VKM B-3413 TaxID=2779401 RepID=UPI001E3F26E1|nr:hypothetical protein [Aurantimonas sp. VKM B-3413]MCB8835942.1 hypothetical protein [Aurantimonas sp. VKM B-3413]
MSLVAIAVRIAAVEAIRGRTLFGGNVLDSEAAALDARADGSLVTDQEKPFVSVYLYSGKHAREAGELRSLFVNGRCDIGFEIGIAATMTVRNEKNEKVVVADLPYTDAANEFILGIVGRQIRAALTDPGNAWGAVFLGLIGHIAELEFATTRRAEGQRVAGHQLMLSADLADDPIPGEALDADTPFGQFLALLDASEDPVRQTQAEMIRMALGPVDDRGWAVLQRRMGLTADELFALGRGPIPQDAEGATPENVATTVEIDGVGTVEVTPS